MNNLFSFDDLKKHIDTEEKRNNEESKDDIKRDNFMKIHTAKVETLKELNGRLPQCGEIFFLWTVNSFNAFTFIPYIIRECGLIDNLVITTYSINRRIVDSLIRYIDKGKIKHVELFISDSLKFRMPRVYDHLSALVAHRADVLRVIYSWNHSKVTLIEAGGNYFNVEGSGNFSENAQHEQYVFLNSKEVYDFRKHWILNEFSN